MATWTHVAQQLAYVKCIENAIFGLHLQQLPVKMVDSYLDVLNVNASATVNKLWALNPGQGLEIAHTWNSSDRSDCYSGIGWQPLWARQRGIDARYPKTALVTFLRQRHTAAPL